MAKNPAPTAELVAQLLADASQAVCPACGKTGFWDNRDSGKKGPAFKCKNKNCETDSGYPFGVFKNELPTDAASGNGSRGGARVRYTSAQLCACYTECARHVTRIAGGIGKKLGVPFVGADLAAMTATLFIQHVQSGAVVTDFEQFDAGQHVGQKPARREAPPPPDLPPADDEDDPNALPF